MSCPRTAAPEDRRGLPAGWDSHGTCTHCGSLSQELFLAACEAGCELGPTDKAYKVYVRRPDPRAGEPMVVGSANFQPTYGRFVRVTRENLASFPRGGLDVRVGSWVEVGARPALTHEKFYFQHLDEEGRARFAWLLAAGKLTVGAPGRFYVRPYFLEGR